MQNMDGEPLFCTNLQNKMTVKFSISLCFRDYDKILIKLEEIFKKKNSADIVILIN